MVAASPKFSLADIRKDMVGKIVKKDKATPSVSKIPASTKVPGSASKKRKTLEILDLTLDDSDPMEVMKKLSIMTEAVRIIVFVIFSRH